MQLKEIRERKQKAGVTYLRYSTAVLSFMHRAVGYTGEERLERLYQNIHPNYQWLNRCCNIRTTRDLLLEATVFEDIQKRQETVTTVARGALLITRGALRGVGW